MLTHTNTQTSPILSHHSSPSHMATSLSLNLTFSFYYFFFLFLILIKFAHTTQQQQQQQISPPITSNNTLPTGKTLLPPPSPPPPSEKSSSSSFKPGIAVVVGVLTTMFSLTFLLLLYIKHCYNVSNDNNTSSYNSTTTTTSRGGLPPSTGRKNSGIDRSVIESLPIFRFGSLMGQKEGLDCAVCLSKFEATEVLRLLPKCKHAFHVECVDTWLDAHSTCPLCRYRVDPEDIFLVHNTKISHQNQEQEHVIDVEKGRNSSSQIADAQTRRISGRHSWVGEREGRILQTSSFFRRSLDSATARKKSENGVVGCFVRPRKDDMLLSTAEETTERERRLEHRIIVSPPCLRSEDQRWSDVQPLDMLYLTSEMIISGGGRKMMMMKKKNRNDDGRGEISTRSVSEMTGLSRFLSNNSNNNNNNNTEEGGRGGQWCREEGLVSRWLAWISISRSHLQTQPAVR